MAKNCNSVCKLCRREGAKMFLKGERCFTDKCAVERRQYPPGQHGPSGRVKFSEFALQLRAKQKIKRTYGVSEIQMRTYFDESAKIKAGIGPRMLMELETRLDNVAYRMGAGTSRAQARQLISHSHVRVNGKKVKVPSYLVRKGDVIEIKQPSKALNVLKNSFEFVKRREIPNWLECDFGSMKATVKDIPVREDISADFNEKMVVELYSK